VYLHSPTRLHAHTEGHSVKLHLSLYSVKYHAMKAQWEWRYSSMNYPLNYWEWSASRSGHFISDTPWIRTHIRSGSGGMEKNPAMSGTEPWPPTRGLSKHDAHGTRRFLLTLVSVRLYSRHFIPTPHTPSVTNYNWLTSLEQFLYYKWTVLPACSLTPKATVSSNFQFFIKHSWLSVFLVLVLISTSHIFTVPYSLPPRPPSLFP
jgi:hypothetical protein